MHDDGESSLCGWPMAVQDRPVALFIGAGVMYPLIPLWNDLLGELLEFAVHTRLYDQYDSSQLAAITDDLTASSQLTVYEKASLVKSLLGRQYIPLLQRIVYRRFHAEFPDGMKDPRVLRENHRKHEYAFLASVLDLCLSPQVTAIVSYNYDTILVRALEESRRAYSVYGATSTHKVGLPVYHVHGCLPDSDAIGDPDAARIVLSQDEYFAVMLEPYSWQTTTQLHYLMNATCLFLGVSLTDANMLRMINHAKTYSRCQAVYHLMATEGIEARTPKTLQDFLIRTRLSLCADVGVRTILVRKYRDLAGKVRELKRHVTPPPPP